MSQTIECTVPSGVACTLGLLSLTASPNTAFLESQPLTEDTIDKGCGRAVFATVATGWHRVVLIRTSDGAGRARGFVNLAGDGGYARCVGRADLAPETLAQLLAGSGPVEVDADAIADAVAGRLTGRVQLLTQFDPDTQRLTLTAGDQVVQEFSNAGWPDLTGAGLVFTVRNAADAVVIELEPELVDSRRVRVTLDPDVTRLPARSDYLFDLQARWSAERIQTLVGPEAPLTVRQPQSR